MYVAGKYSLRHIFLTNLVIKDCLNSIAIITNLHKSTFYLTLSAHFPILNHLSLSYPYRGSTTRKNELNAIQILSLLNIAKTFTP